MKKYVGGRNTKENPELEIEIIGKVSNLYYNRHFRSSRHLVHKFGLANPDPTLIPIWSLLFLILGLSTLSPYLPSYSIHN